MRAAVFTRKGPAGDVLQVVDLPDPEPAAEEVRVRVQVSGVNPTDWKARSPRSPEDRALPWPYQIPNRDGAGVIDTVGPGVASSRLGERVWIYQPTGRPTGTAAQYVCVPQRQAVPMPETTSFRQGAGLGVPYLTAHRCLFADGSVTGRTVLVTGGAGAVGNAAIQLAAWRGAHVISTVSSQEKAQLAAAAGAHEVLNYRVQDFPERLRATAPHGVHRVVDVALERNLGAYVEALAPQSVISSYASTRQRLSLDASQLTLRSSNLVIRFVSVSYLEQAMLDQAVTDITTALEAGALTPLPEHVFTLEEIAAAHEAVEHGAVGKVLVDIP